MITTFYIVRHGQTDWNVEGRLQGQTNSILTEAGKLQAETLADALKNTPFAAAYSSDLIRAKDTAQTIVKHHNIPLITHAALREKSQGKLFEGRLSKEIREEYKDIWEIHNSLDYEEKLNHRLQPDSETIGALQPSEAQVGAIKNTGYIITDFDGTNFHARDLTKINNQK